MIPGLFITGTDTNVGKTRVAAGIVRCLVNEGRAVAVFKPVATGATRLGDGWRCDDADDLIEAAGGGQMIADVAPFLFSDPVAPSVAARLAWSGEGVFTPAQPVAYTSSGETGLTLGRIVEWVRARLAESVGRFDVSIVEGVGGLMCPLAEGATVLDLALALDLPLLVVARRGLGTLNHTLLTVEVARRRGLRIAGVVLNGSEATTNPLAEATNAEELSRYLSRIPILAELPHRDDPGALCDDLRDVDWYGRAERPRWA